MSLATQTFEASPVIESWEDADRLAAELTARVRLIVAAAKDNAELRINRIREDLAAEIAPHQLVCERAEERLREWVLGHKADFPSEAQTLACPRFNFSWRRLPAALELARKKATWKDAAGRLADWHREARVRAFGEALTVFLLTKLAVPRGAADTVAGAHRKIVDLWESTTSRFGPAVTQKPADIDRRQLVKLVPETIDAGELRELGLRIDSDREQAYWEPVSTDVGQPIEADQKSQPEKADVHA